MSWGDMIFVIFVVLVVLDTLIDIRRELKRIADALEEQNKRANH